MPRCRCQGPGGRSSGPQCSSEFPGFLSGNLPGRFLCSPGCLGVLDTVLALAVLIGSALCLCILTCGLAVLSVLITAALTVLIAALTVLVIILAFSVVILAALVSALAVISHLALAAVLTIRSLIAFGSLLTSCMFLTVCTLRCRRRPLRCRAFRSRASKTVSRSCCLYSCPLCRHCCTFSIFTVSRRCLLAVGALRCLAETVN